MDAATLDKAINDAGCPTVSSSVLDPNSRVFWSFIPAAGATPEQIEVGYQVLNTIPVNPATTITTSEFISRFTNAEYRAATAASWRSTAGNAKNWDVVVFEATINFNKKKTVTLKTSLVTDGILTQARADEIFA